jgi:hypothetical protein
MVSKGLPIKHLGKLDGQKGANLGLWMVAKALLSGHPQKAAFPLSWNLAHTCVLRTDLIPAIDRVGAMQADGLVSASLP